MFNDLDSTTDVYKVVIIINSVIIVDYVL